MEGMSNDTLYRPFYSCSMCGWRDDCAKNLNHHEAPKEVFDYKDKDVIRKHD